MEWRPVRSLTGVNALAVTLVSSSASLAKHFGKLAIGFISLRKHLVKLAIGFIALRKHLVKLAIGFIALRKRLLKLAIGSLALRNHLLKLAIGFLAMKNRLLKLATGSFALRKPLAQARHQLRRADGHQHVARSRPVDRGMRSGGIAAVWKHFKDGGWGMYVILFWSIVTVGVVVERSLYLFGASINKEEFVAAMQKCIRAGDIEKAVRC